MSNRGRWQLLAQNVKNGCLLSCPQLRANRTRYTQSENGRLWNVGLVALLGLDIRGPDYLAPLLGLVGDVLRELRRRTRQYDDTHVSKPRLNLGIGEARVDLPVELVDDPNWRVPGSGDAAPATRLETGQGISDRWDVRQRLQACRSRHRQCTQLASPDMFDG